MLVALERQPIGGAEDLDRRDVAGDRQHAAGEARAVGGQHVDVLVKRRSGHAAHERQRAAQAGDAAEFKAVPR